MALQFKSEEIEDLTLSVGRRLKQREFDVTSLKYDTIKLAEAIEKKMIDNKMNGFINCIYSIILRDLKIKFQISKESELLVDGFFTDYPKYRRDIIRDNAPFILSSAEIDNSYSIREVMKTDGVMPEENRVYSSTIDDTLTFLNTMDLSRLTKDQSENVIEKLDNIVKRNKHEASHASHRSTSPIHTSPNNKISQVLIKIRQQWDEMISYAQTMKTPTPELEEELYNYFNTFYRNLRFLTDKKHKISLPDWANLSLASDDTNAHHASSNIKFKTSLCAKCKDFNDELDPEHKKRIYTHVQMYIEYNFKRTKKKPYPYQFVCPRCKGTKRKEVIISRERINEAITHINSLFVDTINHSDILRAINMFLEEVVKPDRLNTSHEISNKILSVR
jgi:hypothetical protein